MLEILSQKLSRIFRGLGAKGRLDEKDVDEALRQVRLALLEADVNFKVVKEFLLKVHECAVGTEVLQSLTPAQQIIKIVNKELVAILGQEPSPLASAACPPTVALLVGLQGSGKTTTAAKLAVLLKSWGHRPLLVAADTRRPAAIKQLRLLGEQQDIPVYAEDNGVAPVPICNHAWQKARETAATHVIVDTGGRLHIDEAMMLELADIKSELHPSEILLTVDAMTGQDAVRATQEFHERIGLTGLILTKMDGDARGGAALSIRFVTGVPIKFMGIGEKTVDLEAFYPERLASRILGMGDMLTLIERAEKTIDQQQVRQMEKKMRTTGFDLADTLAQLRQIQQMGSLGQLAEMLPGFARLNFSLSDDEGENRLKTIEAIILSMTAEERHRPEIINGSRRRRIARGSGTTPQNVNRLLNQFYQMQKLTRAMARGKPSRNLPGMLGRPYK